MVHVTENGKVATCLSEISCNATQRQGLTEMSVVDHSLSQRHKDLISLWIHGSLDVRSWYIIVSVAGMEVFRSLALAASI